MGEIDFIPQSARNFNSTSDCDDNLSINQHLDITPQQSKCCNDPLNWSFLRKSWHTFLLLLITGLMSATTNITWIAQEAMFEEFRITFGKVDIGTGILFIGIGLGTFLLSPVAYLYGRRLPYLICLSLNIIGMVWMSLQRSYQDSICNQFFVGLSGAVVEANVQLSLSEIWFENQQGSVLGMYVLVTSIGTFLGPIISGFVLEDMGWRWIPKSSVIIFSITLVVFYFGLEETLFDRQSYRNKANSNNTPAYSNSGQLYRNVLGSFSVEVLNEKDLISIKTLPDTPRPYRDRINLVTCAPNLIGYGFKQYRDRLHNVLRVFAFPAVFYSGIQWGAQDSWLSFYLKLQQDEWMQQPFNFSQSKSAMMNIPTMIGAIIGCFWGGYCSDCFASYMVKRRSGDSEAEDRLWMMLPCIIISPVGLLIFGLGTVEALNRYWSFMGLGLIGFGWGCAGDLSMSYLMQAYPEIVLESMVGVSLINNGLGCFFSLLSNFWFEFDGVRNCMIGVSCLSLLFSLLTIPMMLWGKSCRCWTFCKYKELVKARDAL